MTLSYFFVGTAGTSEKACRGSKRKNIAVPIEFLSLWKLFGRNPGQWFHNVALLILSSLRTYRHTHITSEKLLLLSLHLTSGAHVSCLFHDRLGLLNHTYLWYMWFNMRRLTYFRVMSLACALCRLLGFVNLHNVQKIAGIICLNLLFK